MFDNLFLWLHSDRKQQQKDTTCSRRLDEPGSIHELVLVITGAWPSGQNHATPRFLSECSPRSPVTVIHVIEMYGFIDPSNVAHGKREQGF